MTLATTSLTHACSKCGDEKSWQDFQLYKGHPVGQCRACKTASEKARRERVGIPVKRLSRLDGDKKLCMCCEEMKPASDFSPTERGLGGISAYCKVCQAAKVRGSGKAKATTAAYRARHPERHKANHRVRMFEYRERRKVTSDGTATDEFLKGLYAQEFCHYCLKFVELANRTADHKTALASGGHHSASNLVMACATCNSSKQDLSEENFLKRGFK